MKKLAIVTTHPIQYNAPFFKKLTERDHLKVKVYYTWGPSVMERKFDPGFEKEIEWDIPILEGYDYEFVKNTSSDPGSHHFNGIKNPTLLSNLQSWKPDAVMIYGWSFRSHLNIMRELHGKIPVFFRGDSTLLQERVGIRKFIRRIFLRWVYSYVDTAFFVGTKNKAYYIAHGLKESQLVFTPHSVDNERFQLNCVDVNLMATQLKEKLGIPEEDIVFLYAGKLDQNKSTKLLLDAFVEINLKHTHIIIVGNGSEENNLKDEFTKYSSIYFLPFHNQNEMPILYRMCDVFVLPSFSETWGLGLNEAMACGKAVIASSGCGASYDLINEGKNGYIFQKGNKDSLKKKLSLIEKARSREMGKSSLEIIQAWNFENICKAVEDSVK